MGLSARTRVAVGLSAVIAAALLPALALVVQLAQGSDWYHPHEDAITAFERRSAALRDALRGVTAIGYLGPDADATAQTARFYITRYTLAPVQVLADADLPLLVADGVQRIPPGFTVRRDFGNGLLLLERSGRLPP